MPPWRRSPVSDSSEALGGSMSMEGGSMSMEMGRHGDLAGSPLGPLKSGASRPAEESRAACAEASGARGCGLWAHGRLSLRRGLACV